jgi:hypothetical protein
MRVVTPETNPATNYEFRCGQGLTVLVAVRAASAGKPSWMILKVQGIVRA